MNYRKKTIWFLRDKNNNYEFFRKKEFKKINFTTEASFLMEYYRCKFVNCNFENTNLEHVDLSSSIGFIINPEQNKMKNCKIYIYSLPLLLTKYKLDI